MFNIEAVEGSDLFNDGKMLSESVDQTSTQEETKCTFYRAIHRRKKIATVFFGWKMLFQARKVKREEELILKIEEDQKLTQQDFHIEAEEEKKAKSTKELLRKIE